MASLSHLAGWKKESHVWHYFEYNGKSVYKVFDRVSIKNLKHLLKEFMYILFFFK